VGKNGIGRVGVGVEEDERRGLGFGTSGRTRKWRTSSVSGDGSGV
jgi:hypothetical protein